MGLNGKGAIDVLFVLRGRPGLGHVIPGLAIAAEFARRRFRVALMTYGNGLEFLERGGDTYGFEEVRGLEVSDEYRDWPGLDLYDHGVREIAPYVEERGVALCVFGGEYVMPPAVAATGAQGAMMFNPEIMEENPRNSLPSRLFCKLFDFCEHLIPLAPLPEGTRYMAEFQALRPRLTPAGPFCFARRAPAGERPEGRTILIANGGGVNFPRQTTSYSSDQTSPATWLEETRRMTADAARAVVEHLREGDRVHVFSCLDEDFNSRLGAELGACGALEIRQPCDSYYDVLGRADLVISRSGNGFISDAQMTDGVVLLWGLTGHDEQRQNALELERRRPSTMFCEKTDDLREAVRGALSGEGRGGGRPAPARHDSNVVKVVDHLEASVRTREKG